MRNRGFCATLDFRVWHNAEVASFKKSGTNMSGTKQRAVAESVFSRNQRREAEINDALRQEAARHEAAVENMHRLRMLRLAREAEANTK